MKLLYAYRIPVLLIAWSCLTIYAFWQMIGRYLRPVGRPVGAALLQPERRPAPPLRCLEADVGTMTLGPNEPVTVLNFWSPTCPCSRFMESHVRSLVTQYSSQGVRFATIIQCGPSEAEVSQALSDWRARGISTAIVADGGGSIARAFGVWAAPGAVILDRSGRIIYVGAYNVARYCNAKKTAFAALALQATLENRPPPRASTPFYGCQVVAQK